MFAVQVVELQPCNCPHCIYAPTTFQDLQDHLNNYHANPSFLLCSEPLCGFVYTLEKNLEIHLTKDHHHKEVAPRRFPLSKKLKRLIKFTEKYFSAVQKLTEHEDCCFSPCDDYLLISLMSHARAAASLYTASSDRTQSRKKRSGANITVDSIESDVTHRNGAKMQTNRSEKEHTFLRRHPREMLSLFEIEQRLRHPMG